MSIVAPVQKQFWVWVAAGVTALLMVTGAIVWANLPGERTISEGGRTSVGAQVAVPQAPWQISARLSGTDGKLTKAQERALAAHAPGAKSLVRRVYDSLFVHPSRLPETLKSYFSPGAARELKRAGAGVTQAVSASTTLRKATVGLQAAGGARLAVADITVRATDADAASAQTFLHQATLWMQREKREWRVIAFSVDQAPLPSEEGKEATSKGNDKGRAGGANPKATGSKERGKKR